MKRRLWLLAVAVFALFAIVAAAPAPMHDSTQAQLFAEQLVPVALAGQALAAAPAQAVLEVNESIGASVPGAKRTGLLAVQLFEGDSTPNTQTAAPPARAVPLERSPGHEAC